MMDYGNTWQLILLMVLLLLSGFFSASETALMSLSKIRVRHMMEEKIKRAEIINKFIKDPSRLLGAILLGNNLVNIAASALATSISIRFFPTSGIAIATVTMTILVLIFGEITPKSIAAQYPEKVSLKVIRPIALMVKILNPIVLVLTYTTNMFITTLGIKINKKQPFITEEELRTIVTVSQEEGVLEIEEKQMIHNVFEFGDLQIKDIMIQRTDIVALDVEASYQEVMEIVKDQQFSRYPVFKDGIDHIIGTLNTKDLVFLDINNENFSIENHIRKPFYTFEFKKISDVFKEMKKKWVHMAIVLDEYGGTAGIITIEDLIEEIVGDIQDEYDELDDEIKVVKENEYIVEGSTRINTVNEMLGIELESQDFDSIGGFIIGELGRLPRNGETIQYESIKITVECIERNRIQRIRIFT
ncbi:hemolysin family protein [Anaerovirgula multivorans]|nr:hemolysin family protein [Anaerovirgula multivorans]